MPSLSPIHQASLDRWKTLIPENSSDLIVLKGHLLIEELLLKLLQKSMPKYSCIKDSRLSFSQRLSIVSALLPEKHYNKVFLEVKNLNKVRNALSHKIEVPDIEKVIGDFCSGVELSLDMSSKYIQANIEKRLRFAIVLICAELSILLHNFDVTIVLNGAGPPDITFVKNKSLFE